MLPHQSVAKVRRTDVPDLADDAPPGLRLPSSDPLVETGDRDQRVRPEFLVNLPSCEVVDGYHLVTPGREMKSRGPAKVSIRTENDNSHAMTILNPVLTAAS
jgi:hypothetical protein